MRDIQDVVEQTLELLDLLKRIIGSIETEAERRYFAALIINLGERLTYFRDLDLADPAKFRFAPLFKDLNAVVRQRGKPNKTLVKTFILMKNMLQHKEFYYNHSANEVSRKYFPGYVEQIKVHLSELERVLRIIMGVKEVGRFTLSDVRVLQDLIRRAPLPKFQGGVAAKVLPDTGFAGAAEFLLPKPGFAGADEANPRPQFGVAAQPFEETDSFNCIDFVACAILEIKFLEGFLMERGVEMGAMDRGRWGQVLEGDIVVFEIARNCLLNVQQAYRDFCGGMERRSEDLKASIHQVHEDQIKGLVKLGDKGVANFIAKNQTNRMQNIHCQNKFAIISSLSVLCNMNMKFLLPLFQGLIGVDEFRYPVLERLVLPAKKRQLAGVEVEDAGEDGALLSAIQKMQSESAGAGAGAGGGATGGGELDLLAAREEEAELGAGGVDRPVTPKATLRRAFTTPSPAGASEAGTVEMEAGAWRVGLFGSLTKNGNLDGAVRSLPFSEI
jgi:hypothetical protein